MYVNEFVCGIIVTILAEIAIFAAWVIYYNKKHKGN